ncbi:MAG: hypothetical protein DBX55_07720 [Verrucomicrobia bacterium]|nr:MAG: hypothetical protein DBX55_07720 [Verrucomicrobiota bacterium]
MRRAVGFFAALFFCGFCGQSLGTDNFFANFYFGRKAHFNAKIARQYMPMRILYENTKNAPQNLRRISQFKTAG